MLTSLQRPSVPSIIWAATGSHLCDDLNKRRNATCQQSHWGLGFIYLTCSLPWRVLGQSASGQTTPCFVLVMPWAEVVGDSNVKLVQNRNAWQVHARYRQTFDLVELCYNWNRILFWCMKMPSGVHLVANLSVYLELEWVNRVKNWSADKILTTVPTVLMMYLNCVVAVNTRS